MGGSLVQCKGRVGGACCQVVAPLLNFFSVTIPLPLSSAVCMCRKHTCEVKHYGCFSGFRLLVHASFYTRVIASFCPLTLFSVYYWNRHPDSLPLSSCSGLFTAARKSGQQQPDRPSGVSARKTLTGLTKRQPSTEALVRGGRRDKRGGRGTGGWLVSTLSRFSTQNGTMFLFGNRRALKNWS